MSVFHRVDRARSALPGPLYFARAVRLAAYAGVMQSRMLERDAGNLGPSAAQKPSAKVSDEVALDMLANEGWVEHKRG